MEYDTDALKKLLESKDVEAIKSFMAENHLIVKDGRIVPNDEERIKQLKTLSSFWDNRQLGQKIRLNALYGALLNESMRFFDPRLGQSTTLSGRSIVKHMNSKINEVMTGKYDYKGDAIIYADTDSCYFTATEILKSEAYKNFDASRENIIALYDAIAEEANESFPEFMARTFHTTLARGAKIKAGRELVGSRGLFIKKKKYAILMYDKDGERLDVGNKPGKLKPMGLDLKRADTPKFMQKFLETVLMDLLQHEPKEALMKKTKQFRSDFMERPGWEKGSPKKVSSLTKYTRELVAYENIGVSDKISKKKGAATVKPRIPGHVLAAINWNRLCESNQDRFSMRITDGSKVIVCKLKKNLMGITSVAYPIDEPHLPEWFKKLPFDHSEMENVIIDNKLDNLLGVLGWDFEETKTYLSDDLISF